MAEPLRERVANVIGRLRAELGPEILWASAARNPSDAGLLWMLGILQDRHVGTMLEIGTCHGVMAAVLGLVCKRVTTVDCAAFRPHHADRGGSSAFARVPEVLATAGASNVWAFLAKDENEKQQIVRRLRFGAAFIDGLHTAAGADFEAVRHCGCVFFHNAETQGGVKAFLATIGPVERCGDFAVWRHPDG